MKKLSCLILLGIILFPKSALAFSMQGGEYNINGAQVGEDIITPTMESSDQPASPDYTVTYGFDNLKSTSASSISISDSTIDFGSIAPGEPITRTNTLTITPESSLGYDVLLSEDHEPTATGAKIPDTTCDDGNCSETSSSSWTSPLTYGYGVRCESQNQNTCSGFVGLNDFKQVANSQLLENGQPILSSSTNQKSTANIQYRLNIAGNQIKTAYRNTLLFMFSPHI